MRIRVFTALLIAAAFLLTPRAPAVALAQAIHQLAVMPTMFDTEVAAQRHCPRDVVVWLNTKTGIYHEKGMRWYGRTKNGAYVCKKEADVAGDRDTRNGE